MFSFFFLQSAMDLDDTCVVCGLQREGRLRCWTETLSAISPRLGVAKSKDLVRWDHLPSPEVR